MLLKAAKSARPSVMYTHTDTDTHTQRQTPISRIHISRITARYTRLNPKTPVYMYIYLYICLYVFVVVS